MEPLYVDCYSFDPLTGEYAGVSQAWADPLTPGEYMLPASATFIEPPAAQAGKVRRWTGNVWIFIDAPTPTEVIEQPTTEEQVAANARIVRNRLLAATDWTQVRDVPIDATVSYAFAVYRQELRDVPQQPGFPMEINWPVAPQYVKR